MTSFFFFFFLARSSAGSIQCSSLCSSSERSSLLLEPRGQHAEVEVIRQTTPGIHPGSPPTSCVPSGYLPPSASVLSDVNWKRQSQLATAVVAIKENSRIVHSLEEVVSSDGNPRLLQGPGQACAEPHIPTVSLTKPKNEPTFLLRIHRISNRL